MGKTDLVQINLKLTPELLTKIDAAVARAGNTNRSDWLRAGITSLCERRLPAAPSVGSTVDQGARDALLALKDRIDKLEGDSETNHQKLMMLVADLTDQLSVVMQTQKEAINTAVAVNDDFSDAFLKGSTH